MTAVLGAAWKSIPEIHAAAPVPAPKTAVPRARSIDRAPNGESAGARPELLYWSTSSKRRFYYLTWIYTPWGKNVLCGFMPFSR